VWDQVAVFDHPMRLIVKPSGAEYWQQSNDRLHTCWYIWDVLNVVLSKETPHRVFVECPKESVHRRRQKRFLVRL